MFYEKSCKRTEETADWNVTFLLGLNVNISADVIFQGFIPISCYDLRVAPICPFEVVSFVNMFLLLVL